MANLLVRHVESDPQPFGNPSPSHALRDLVLVNSTGGNDTIKGGDNTHNALFGDATTAHFSTGGDDILISGANARDDMYGDFPASPVIESTGGRDTFVFAPDNGTDYVHDFHPGEDTIALTDFDLPPLSAEKLDRLPEQAFNRLLDRQDISIETVGQDSVIHFDETGDNSVTVYGVSHLTPSDFSFVL